MASTATRQIIPAAFAGALRYRACSQAGQTMPPLPGSGYIDLNRVNGDTVVTRLRADNPLKLLVPRQRQRAAWVIASCFGGGLVAGDTLAVDIRLGNGAVAYFGTQASTKVYRSTRNTPCRQNMRMTIGDGALAVIAPDPVTCFANAVYEQRQRFDLYGNSGLVLIDWQTAGRVARGERWAFNRYYCRNDVYVNEMHALADAMLLDTNHGPITALHRVGPYDCFAMMAMIGQKVADLAERLAAHIDARPVERHSPMVVAASRFKSGVLVRVAGRTTSQVNAFLHEQLQPLTNALGEDPWARKW